MTRTTLHTAPPRYIEIRPWLRLGRIVGKRQVRILVGTTDDRDDSPGRVDSQRLYVAHLHAQTNATCESFLKTLKREEIHARTYRDFEVLRERMEEFIERSYNVCRLHSALDYRSPEDYENESQRESQRTSAAAMMTFFGG